MTTFIDFLLSGNCCGLAALCEKPLEPLSRVVRENIACYLHMMIQPQLPRKIDYAPAHACFGLPGSINQPCDAGVKNCAHAHYAGLERDVKRAIDEAVIIHMPRRVAQRHHFGMGRWIG